MLFSAITSSSSDFSIMEPEPSSSTIQNKTFSPDDLYKRVSVIVEERCYLTGQIINHTYHEKKYHYHYSVKDPRFCNRSMHALSLDGAQAIVEHYRKKYQIDIRLIEFGKINEFFLPEDHIEPLVLIGYPGQHGIFSNEEGKPVHVTPILILPNTGGKYEIAILDSLNPLLLFQFNPDQIEKVHYVYRQRQYDAVSCLIDAFILSRQILLALKDDIEEEGQNEDEIEEESYQDYLFKNVDEITEEWWDLIPDTSSENGYRWSYHHNFMEPSESSIRQLPISAVNLYGDFLLYNSREVHTDELLDEKVLRDRFSAKEDTSSNPKTYRELFNRHTRKVNLKGSGNVEDEKTWNMYKYDKSMKYALIASRALSSEAGD